MVTESKNNRLTLFTLLLISTLTVMAGATIAPALPAMQQEFSSFQNVDFWIRLVLTIPGLFIVLGAFLSGYIIDRYSKKNFLLACILLYAIAGSSGLYLDSLPAILAGRGIMGLGVAGIMTTVITLFADYYEGQERAKVIGMQASFMALGGVLFLSLGGFLAELNWRLPFGIYLIALAFIPFGMKYLYEPERKLIDNTLNEQISFKSATSLIKLLVLVYALVVSAQIIFYTIPIHLPFYLMDTFGTTASISGLAIATVTLFAGLTSMLYGRVKGKFGYVYIMVISFLAIGLGYTIVSSSENASILILGLVTIGIGFGTFIPNVNTWLAEVAPEKYRGRVMGGITTFVFLGQFLSPIATQPILVALEIPGLYLTSGAYLLTTGALLLLFRNPLIRLCEKVSRA